MAIPLPLPTYSEHAPIPTLSLYSFISSYISQTNNSKQSYTYDNILRSCESLGWSSFEKFTSCCLAHFL